jgi:DNA replication protein DnaC
MKSLIDQCQIAIRKVKIGQQRLTVKDVKGSAVTGLIHEDKAYKFLANIRGSPPYFQKISKDLFAMIRQLGPATFFVTLSAAETRWLHLLRILGKTIEDKCYTDEELQSMTWDQKCHLIQSDPVTCARHFHHSVSKFLSDVLFQCNPLGKIKDHFYRVEFQQRGSPHIHMMVWCDDAPQFGKNSDEEICNFVDKFIMCRKTFDDESESLQDLVQLQTHRHSSTCKKKKLKKCRFGFPKPPMKKTTIVYPLSEPEFSKKDVEKHRKLYHQIEEILYDSEDDAMSFDEFLLHLGISEEQYTLAVRSSINTATIMLQRKIGENRVNNYNGTVLKAWRANIDVQFILDVYACATYIASYITKSHRGMSELLRKAVEEVKAGNSTLKQQIRTVGNKFLNSVEISAQEAAYICLQLPMKCSSRKVVFINTSPPAERVNLLKSQQQLDQLDENSDDIECSNDIQRYSERPQDMENVTLAEFIAFYEKKQRQKGPSAKSVSEKDVHTEADCDNDDDDDVVQEEENPQGKVIDEGPMYRRKQHANIIRPVHFNPDFDPEKYYRELIMLYTHWRDENTMKEDQTTYAEEYTKHKDNIEAIRKLYEPFADVVDAALEHIQNHDQDDAWDQLSPENQQQNDEDLSNTIDQPDAGIEDADIAQELGIPVKVSAQEDLHPYNELSDEEYRAHMQKLTPDQLEFVYDTVHEIKVSDQPIYRFLSGGAGVGKSYVTKALYQTALKFLNTKAGEDFSSRRVLVLAPTGKAAYHVKGTTIHSGLRIPANQKLEHKPLQSSALNTLRNEISTVKLLFIDEISMVGFKLFNCVNQRLMEVMQSPKPFGGISVVAVGDLFQLKPVMDSYIFNNPSSGYFPLATNPWQDLFSMIELKDIMRQADNRPFAELLNRLREANHTNLDIACLKEHIIGPGCSNYPVKAPHLFATNDQVDSYNAQVILQMNGNKVKISAKDQVVGSTPLSMKEKILSSFKRGPQTKQLPNILDACEGVWHDLTINLDTEDGLINGASCIIQKLDIPIGRSYPCGKIWVQFHDRDIGKNLRLKKKHFFKPGIELEWTPVEPVVKQFPAGHQGQALVQRLQFPLRPSHAKTIHRSQGDTLSEAVVDLTTRRKIDHLHYVAISRVTDLENLHILNLQEDKISVSEDVKKEMDRLRSNPLTLSQRFIHHLPCTFRTVYLNIDTY